MHFFYYEKKLKWRYVGSFVSATNDTVIIKWVNESEFQRSSSSVNLHEGS